MLYFVISAYAVLHVKTIPAINMYEFCVKSTNCVGFALTKGVEPCVYESCCLHTVFILFAADVAELPVNCGLW